MARLRVSVAGVGVGVVALLALGSTALHANQAQSALAASANTPAAQQSNAYFACLAAQAHSLVGARDVAYLGGANLSRWVTVTKVMGGWAHLTLQRSDATVALLLEHRAGPGTCDGDVLISIRESPTGQVVMRRGTQSIR